MSPRTGFFHYFEGRETLIRLYDEKSEDFSTEPLSTDTINKYRIEHLPYFDQFLGPYPFEQYKQWISLTDLIGADLFKRMNSHSGLIRSVSAIVPKEFVSHRNKMDCDSSKNDLNDLNFKLDEQHLLKFTDVDRLQAYPANSTPQQITRNKIDNSFLLEQLIEAHGGDENSVLGELQFAFVVFLIGQNYDAFERWKKLFRLVCKASQAMIGRPEFFISFIRVLYFQLKEVPSDTFVDILENDNFLLGCLRDFFLNIQNQENQLSESLIGKCKQFQEYLTKQYEWEFDIEPDDEAPVVVELSE